METHLEKIHKVLFIWHEEIDAPYYVQDLLFYLYILFLPLMLLGILSFSFYPTPTSDLHTSYINSTLSTCVGTKLQNHYSDPLSDLESFTKTTYLIYSSSVFSKSLEVQNTISSNQLKSIGYISNPTTAWVPYFISPLQN